jgi:predicted NBD/HSP70 family sugar kinase
VLEPAIALANEVFREERASGGDVRAIGVSTMGRTRADRADPAPNVAGWTDLAISSMIEEAFPTLPAAFGNDVKLAALAGLTWGALASVACGVYLNLGTGIAAALVGSTALRDHECPRTARHRLRRPSAAGVPLDGPPRFSGGLSRLRRSSV